MASNMRQRTESHSYSKIGAKKENMAKRVAVIGAGPAGLTAIKSCLEEGLNVTCYDITDHIGGVWKYDEHNAEEGVPSMFESVHMNTSRDMSSFSDFPAPTTFANFMTHSQTYSYFQMYADHFKLRQHVLLRHRVTLIQRAPDFKLTGRWMIRVRDIENEKDFEEMFDFVMVCSGVNFQPNIPTYPNMEEFTGQLLHSRQYKTPQKFRGQTVLVVGLGNSGVDIAVDVCRTGCKTFLSTRRRGWIFRRSGENGRPNDAASFTMKEACLNAILPFNMICSRTERLSHRFLDHELYGLKPNHRVFSQFLVISDHLQLHLLYGDIVLKREIARFSSNGVVFQGENHETPVDTVIFATGFHFTFPFLEHGVVDVQNPDDIYKFIFPLRPEHQTLALIGYTIPDGPTFPMFELQSRVAVRVFTGHLRLPSKEILKAEMERKRRIFRKEFYPGYNKLTHVRWMTYVLELGSLIGVSPNIFRLFLTDPHLFWHCFFGPFLPYYFRLRGLHSWSEARNIILDYEQRIARPFCSSGPKACCGFRRWKIHLFAPAVAFLSLACGLKYLYSNHDISNFYCSILDVIQKIRFYH